MPRIPAICEKCRTIFRSGVNLGTSATNISFVNCTAGPCPNCGSTGRILDGIYNAVGNAVEAFIGQQDTSYLKQLLAVLELAKKEEWGHEKVVSNITSTTPTFKKVVDWIPKSTTELYAFIVILIMLINTLIDSRKGNFTKNELIHHTEVTINNCYETNTENQPMSKPGLPISAMPVDTKQVGRNDPCPCGSGKKYKKCCGP